MLKEFQSWPDSSMMAAFHRHLQGLEERRHKSPFSDDRFFLQRQNPFLDPWTLEAEVKSRAGRTW